MEDKGSAGTTAVENADSSPAKKSTPKGKSTKVQRTKSSHPPTSEMVNAAIRELKDRKGSSLQAIKKYMTSTYKVDGEKLAPFIKRYLKSAVTSGAVVQTKGKGASGSFKLSVTKGTESKTKVQRPVKAAEPKKLKISVEKKTTSVRKPAPKKSPSPMKKAATAKKSPKKAAKVAEKPKPTNETKPVSRSRKAKAPAAKTKAPKPKKAAAKSVKTAKK
ncbi:histone H1A, sperm-like [Hylaeus anthracinus]|uniref:histone H1A, sperm-like n=1 Tax=Hylaeus anthracinus TaxID=313031 RepID=UPI0023BA1F8E|nr:histone H1A, sperm-like [Hylaeus anthracinus]